MSREPTDTDDFIAWMTELRAANPARYHELLGVTRAMYLTHNPTLPDEATLPERWSHWRASRRVRAIDFARAAELRATLTGGDS